MIVKHFPAPLSCAECLDLGFPVRSARRWGPSEELEPSEVVGIVTARDSLDLGVFKTPGHQVSRSFASPGVVELAAVVAVIEPRVLEEGGWGLVVDVVELPGVGQLVADDRRIYEAPVAPLWFAARASSSASKRATRDSSASIREPEASLMSQYWMAMNRISGNAKSNYDVSSP